MTKKAKFLLIDAYDFEGYPTGGSGTLCDQLIKSFGNDVALVGLTTRNSEIVKQWRKKKILGTEYDFYAVKYTKKLINKKPLIPGRLKWYIALHQCKEDIVNYGCSNIFTQSPETLLVISNWGLDNICYTFAGLTNPLSMSRFKWARLFDNLFEKIFRQKLKKVNSFLAAASSEEISAYSQKISNYGIKIKINQFPTRVDTSIFYPMNKNELRIDLDFNLKSKIIITSGRLSEVKGWRLMLDSFKLFLKDYPDSYFLFIGDGQDKPKIEDYLRDSGIREKVKLLGFLPKVQLAKYLNISDIYVMGSFFEGWPTSMVEAIACGIPICSTDFGSAKEILNNEKIGVIVNGRNPEIFAEQMKKAILLTYNEQLYSFELEKYTVKNLQKELCKYWIF
jgi:glycosyltransferase involved in cell wall biosynthesis